MTAFGLSEKSIQIIQTILQQYPVEHALIFGSRAIGNYKPGSDIDIALQGQALTDAITLTIRARLNEETPLPYECDVVNYQTLPTGPFKTHIDTYGQPFPLLTS